MRVCFYSALIDERHIVTSVSLCVFVGPRSYLRNYVSDFVSKFLCMSLMAVARSSTGSIVVHCVRISHFIDDVIFARKLRLLDVTARLRQ